MAWSQCPASRFRDAIAARASASVWMGYARCATNTDPRSVLGWERSIRTLRPAKRPARGSAARRYTCLSAWADIGGFARGARAQNNLTTRGRSLLGDLAVLRKIPSFLPRRPTAAWRRRVPILPPDAVAAGGDATHPAAAGVHSGVPSSPPRDEELGASPFSDPSAHHGRASATPRRSSVDVALVGDPSGAPSRPPNVDRDKAAAGVTTTREASVNLANCIMGAGALSLPAFFRSCGVLLGVALLLVSCAWTWFSAVMMLKAADVISARHLRGAPIASYEELMDLTLGARGKAASTVGILLLQVGCLVGYANILADVVSPFAVDVLPPGLEPSRAAFIAAVTLGGMLPVGVLVGGDGGSPLLAAVSQFSIAVVGLFAFAMAATRWRRRTTAGAPPRRCPVPPPRRSPPRVDRCRRSCGRILPGRCRRFRSPSSLSARTPPSFPWCGP